MELMSKVCCIGLDCHKNFSSVTARDAQSQVVFRRRLDHRDRGLLRQALSSWPARTPVILEGTFGWGWMSDEVRDANLDPHLCNGRKVAGWREARGLAKSNKRDADLISELWFQQPRWWEVWCAGPEVRDMRELLRYRMGLVGMQTMLKNQIHATLHRHGLCHDFSDLFGVAGRAWLSALIAQPSDLQAPGDLLRDNARETLRGHLGMLDQIRKRIAAATVQFRRQLKVHPAAKRLMTLPGVSTVLGYTIAAEIGQIERFASARHLSRYSLLAPMSDDSGEPAAGAPVNRHVGKQGRLTLKWAWIAAARNAVRRQGPLKDLFDRYTDNGKHDRNRGYIAVAHRMCLIGYVLWKKDVDYQPMPPPRPGSPAWRQLQARSEPKTPPWPATSSSESKTPDPAPGRIFCGEKAKLKERASRSKDQRSKPDELSRPGTGQPHTAMAAETPLRQGNPCQSVLRQTSG
jgi:transposase